MPTAILDADLRTARAFFKARRLAHLRCRARADAIIVESGPGDDPIAHVRLKKLTATEWAVDESHHTGRWAPLPIKAPLPDALAAIVADFSWTLDA